MSAPAKRAALKIIHAAENIKGGVGTYLRDLLALQRQTFADASITVIVPASQSDILQSPAGIDLITFDDRSGRLVNALRLARIMQRVVTRCAPNIIHVHSTFAGAVLRPSLFARAWRGKLIYCPHGWAFDRVTTSRARWGAQFVERVLAKLCDAIVCISNYELQAALRCGIPPGKLTLIRNGVPRTAPAPADDPASIDWPAGRRRVLFVGRFDRQKGVDVLLAAVAALPDTVFACLIGGTVLHDAPLELVPGNVRLYEWLSAAQLESFYRSADVIVVPSRWEGFGLIAAEAMRAGLPVIASRIGGLPELVEDGVTGVLIPYEGTQALIAVLRDLSAGQLRTMGEAGRQRFIRYFTMERMHLELCGLYSKLVP
jgi:glycosyltransferase involved in cell wall biosynthesis